MAVRRNSYFNNPALGQGFSNLAAVFKPPTGAEAYGYAKAGEIADRKKALAGLAQFFGPDMQALAAADPDGFLQHAPKFDLYRRSAVPGAQPRDLDASIAAVLGADKSFEGIDTKEMGDTNRTRLTNAGNLAVELAKPVSANATRFNAPGVASLYGVPAMQVGTLSANADETVVAPDGQKLTGVPRTAMEVAGARDREVLSQAGQTERKLLEPVGPNATRFNTPSVQNLYSVPEAQTGVTTLNRGEVADLPGGERREGLPVPQTKSEWEAAMLSSLSIPQQTSVAMQGVPVEEVIINGAPQIVPRDQAVGRAPYDAPTGQPQLFNYQTVQGGSGTAVYDPIEGYKDTQTGEKLPPNITTFTAQLSGDGDKTGLGPTKTNVTNANNQAAEITRTLAQIDIYEALIDNNPGAIGLPGLIRGTAQNAVQTINDMARSFNKSAPEIQAATAGIKRSLSGVAPELFDPSIPEAAFMQGMLAYSLARTENPSGEVSRQAYDRAFERIRGGGALANTASSKAAMGAFRNSLNAQLQGINALRDPSQARTDTGQQGVQQPVFDSPEAVAASGLPSGTPFKNSAGEQLWVP